MSAIAAQALWGLVPQVAAAFVTAAIGHMAEMLSTNGAQECA